tara:strand:- start:414 stop:962 length:549 start_codon:yes stop_codon:yes gene_type:complete
MSKYQPGYYDAVIIDQDVAANARTGNPQIVLEIEPMRWSSFDGKVNDEPCSQNWSRRVYMTLTDKTKDMVVTNLRNLGFGGSDFSDIKNKKDEAGCRLLGVQGRFKMEFWQKDDGTQSESWSLVSSRRQDSERRPIEEVDSKVLLEMDANFSSALAKVPAKAVAKTEPEPAADTADTEESPF